MNTILDEALTGVIGHPFKVKLNHVIANDFIKENSSDWSSCWPKLGMYIGYEQVIKMSKELLFNTHCVVMYKNGGHKRQKSPIASHTSP